MKNVLDVMNIRVDVVALGDNCRRETAAIKNLPPSKNKKRRKTLDLLVIRVGKMVD